jgi:hypothetical protein
LVELLLVEGSTLLFPPHSNVWKQGETLTLTCFLSIYAMWWFWSGISVSRWSIKGLEQGIRVGCGRFGSTPFG